MCGKSPCNSPTCTWSEAHRRECEARTVMRMPEHDRKAFYRDVIDHRGQQAAVELRNEVNRQWSIKSRTMAVKNTPTA